MTREEFYNQALISAMQGLLSANGLAYDNAEQVIYQAKIHARLLTDEVFREDTSGPEYGDFGDRDDWGIGV